MVPSYFVGVTLCIGKLGNDRLVKALATVTIVSKKEGIKHHVKDRVNKIRKPALKVVHLGCWGGVATSRSLLVCGECRVSLVAMIHVVQPVV